MDKVSKPRDSESPVTYARASWFEYTLYVSCKFELFLWSFLSLKFVVIKEIRIGKALFLTQRYMKCMIQRTEFVIINSVPKFRSQK